VTPPAWGFGQAFARVSLPLVGMSFLNQGIRSVTAVIGPEIATEFALSAADLGLLAALLFAAYAVAQIPVGVALDRYGPGTVQTVLALLIAGGSVLFALAGGWLELAAGRVVLGMGIAAALMAQMKAGAQWYPPARVPAVNGLCVCLGALGGLAATWPASLALRLTDWRGLSLGIAALALLVALWVRLSVPDRPPGTAPQATTLASAVATVGAICRNAEFQRVVPAVALLSALNFTWQGLWAGPWLRDVAHLGTEARAQVLFAYAAGLAAGSLLWGVAASALVGRGVRPMRAVHAAMLGLALIQLVLAFRPEKFLMPLWAAFSFTAAAGSIGYTLIAQRFPVAQTGRVSTAINAIMLAMVFVLQSAIGAVLDLWPRTAAGGWDPRGYSAALVMTLALQALATAWMRLGRRLPAATADRL
jgi:predicted MFS family arabinose efflux permease